MLWAYKKLHCICQARAEVKTILPKKYYSHGLTHSVFIRTLPQNSTFQENSRDLQVLNYQ